MQCCGSGSSSFWQLRSDPDPHKKAGSLSGSASKWKVWSGFAFASNKNQDPDQHQRKIRIRNKVHILASKVANANPDLLLHPTRTWFLLFSWVSFVIYLKKVFSLSFFFIYIYVGLQCSVAYHPPPDNDSLEGFKLVTDIMKLYISSRSGRSELERIFLFIPPPGT